MRDGIKSLNQKGVCPETLWAYDDTPPLSEGGLFPIGSKPVTKPSQSCYDVAVNYVITNYQSLSQNLSQLLGCLASGYPFVFGFSVYSSWYDQNPYPTIIPLPSQTDSQSGGHAVLCVGYDNLTQLFKIRNSWGREVGENGYFYMPYSYLTSNNLSSDFWVINAVKD